VPLQKTSDVDAVVISDSEDEEQACEEPVEKKRRLSCLDRVQYQRYHYLGPEAWQIILQNMLDSHADAPEHIKRDVAPFSAATPTFVVAMMARRDALDLTKAWPKIVKQHPHIRLNLIMLVSVGELEATESACLRRLADAYMDGGFAVPGLAPLPAVPADWEKQVLDQIHEENVQKILKFGSLETVEMSKGRPVITAVLCKWQQHREFGPRIQALIAKHEQEWGCQPQSPTADAPHPEPVAAAGESDNTTASPFVDAASIENILFSLPAIKKELTIEFCMGHAVYLSNKSGNTVDVKAGTAICGWGRLRQRPASEAEAKQIEAKETVPGLLSCSWAGKAARCLYKHAISNVLDVAKSLRSQGCGSMVHLQVRGYEKIDSSTEVLQPTTAAPPTIWLYTEEPIPAQRPEGQATSLKPSQCAALLPQQVPRCAFAMHSLQMN
jgi:hypothetical protein